MSILADFAANEIGWTQVLDRLARAQAAYQRDAASADTHDAHLDARGKMRGIEHALVLIERARAEFRSTK